ncbi:MAG: hypothetical protein ACI9HK_006155, partial [Pirellulaceae bacterium]
MSGILAHTRTFCRSQCGNWYPELGRNQVLMPKMLAVLLLRALSKVF